ncbi:MAG: hypothetical protein V1774_07110 [Candidatus Eisenbacteria bacterium]
METDWIADEIDRIEAEIRRIEHQWRSLWRAERGAHQLPARWTFSRRALRWHVVLEDVLEPDVDIEVLPHVLIVRARAEGRGDRLFMGLLPVPADFDAVRPRIRLERDTLLIVVRRRTAPRGRA